MCWGVLQEDLCVLLEVADRPLKMHNSAMKKSKLKFRIIVWMKDFCKWFCERNQSRVCCYVCCLYPTEYWCSIFIQCSWSGDNYRSGQDPTTKGSDATTWRIATGSLCAIGQLRGWMQTCHLQSPTWEPIRAALVRCAQGPNPSTPWPSRST